MPGKKIWNARAAGQKTSRKIYPHSAPVLSAVAAAGEARLVPLADLAEAEALPAKP